MATMSGTTLKERKWAKEVDVRPFIGYDRYDTPMHLMILHSHRSTASLSHTCFGSECLHPSCTSSFQR